MPSSPLVKFSLSLGVIFVVLLSGAGIFSALERDSEIERRQDAQLLLQELQSILNQTMLDKLQLVCTRKQGLPDPTGPVHWDYKGSLWFVATMVTTIGYGHYTPVTGGGKAMVVFYGAIGIVATGYCLSVMAGQFLLLLPPLIKKVTKREGDLVNIGSPLLLLFLIWFIGSGIIAGIEGWNYGDGLYFGFVTLATIGFGDFVPVKPAGIFFWFIYILFGLGTLAVTLGMVTKALAPRVEQALIEAQENINKRIIAARNPRSDEVEQGDPNAAYPPAERVVVGEKAGSINDSQELDG